MRRQGGLIFRIRKNAYENSLKIRRRVDEILEKIGDVELVDISFLNEEALLYQACDVERAAQYFREKKIDALFVPHANFGNEEAVVKLCREFSVPILVWGPRDEAPPEDMDIDRRTRSAACLPRRWGFFGRG